MDIEQLKLLVDLARDAGQGAFIILTLWALKGYFAISTATVLIAYIVAKVIAAVREHAFGRELMRIAGYPTADYNGWQKSHMDTLRDAAAELRRR